MCWLQMRWLKRCLLLLLYFTEYFPEKLQICGLIHWVLVYPRRIFRPWCLCDKHLHLWGFASPNLRWSLCCGHSVSVLCLLHPAHLPTLPPEIIFFSPMYSKFLNIHARNTARVVQLEQVGTSGQAGNHCWHPPNSPGACRSFVWVLLRYHWYPNTTPRIPDYLSAKTSLWEQGPASPAGKCGQRPASVLWDQLSCSGSLGSQWE